MGGRRTCVYQFYMIPVAGISDIYESVNVVFSDLGDVSIEYGSLCGQVEYTVYISVFEDVANACGILAVFPVNSDHFNITSFQFLTEGFAYEAFAASYNHLHL